MEIGITVTCEAERRQTRLRDHDPQLLVELAQAFGRDGGANLGRRRTVERVLARRLIGLAGFVGEIVILTGVYKSGLPWPALLALVPIIISSAYMLRLYQGAMNGPEVEDLPQRRDLTWIEGLAVAPLLAALVYLGVNPSALLAGILK